MSDACQTGLLKFISETLELESQLPLGLSILFSLKYVSLEVKLNSLFYLKLFKLEKAH